MPTWPAQLGASFNAVQDSKLYNTLLMLALLLDTISPGAAWKHQLQKLIAAMPEGTTEAMGFCEGWQASSVWAEIRPTDLRL